MGLLDRADQPARPQPRACSRGGRYGQLDGNGSTPRAITAMECVISYDWQKVEANHARLRELWAAAETALLVNAHDPQLLDRGSDEAEPLPTPSRASG
ncbi:hypothetical protein ACIA5H_32890 [Nocardia sp. NPDC051900]|uniref:hypothetical protein n=1 Tax=Nocardia sp. NPDC051900 TaxID=3364326 RepID=UPI0037B02BA5